MATAAAGGGETSGQVVVTDMSADERRQMERERDDMKRERARIDKVCRRHRRHA